MEFVKTFVRIIGVDSSKEEESPDISAYEKRPQTLRPHEFSVLHDYSDQERTTFNLSESATASMQYCSNSMHGAFLDMKKVHTYEDLRNSADHFFRYRLLQLSMKLSPDWEGIARSGDYLTQHDVLILRDSESFEKKLNALESFPKDVAGEWQNMEGDLLLFPAPEDNTDYSHLLKTLQDIVISLKCLSNVKYGMPSMIVKRYTSAYLVEKYDEVNHPLENCAPFSLSVFKPVFHPTNFGVVTKTKEASKIVLILKFLEKAALIYMKLADFAMASGRLGCALALCRIQRYCCDHISVIIDCQLDLSAYTHITTNWMMATIYFKLYDRLHRKGELSADESDYESTKEEVESVYACIADLRTDILRIINKFRIVEYPWKFLDKAEELLRTARVFFAVVSVPPQWRRTTSRKLFVDCKYFLFRFKQIIGNFALAAKMAHANRTFVYPRDPLQPGPIATYVVNNVELHHRPRAAQMLLDYITMVDGVRVKANKDLHEYTYCNDFKRFLFVLSALTWKISAVSLASQVLHDNRTKICYCEDSPIVPMERFYYAKMRDHFYHASANFCVEDNFDKVSVGRSSRFRIKVLMKGMREEVVVQIENERRDPNYKYGVLGLVETLLSVTKVAKYEKYTQLPYDDLPHRCMLAVFLSGLSTIYLVKYEKVKAKSYSDEAAKLRQMGFMLHNARYYYHALALYVHKYPYVVREVLATYIDHTDVVTDFYCSGGPPLSAVAHDLLALRRLMPIMPIAWEFCIARRRLTGPMGYQRFDMPSIRIPFHKSFIDKTYGPLSPDLHSTVELMQLPKEYCFLEGDSLYENTNKFHSHAQTILERLSSKIASIAVDDIDCDEDLPTVIVAQEVATIISTAKGGDHLSDFGHQKARLAQRLSKCLARLIVPHLHTLQYDPSEWIRTSLKRTAASPSDRMVLTFTSTFAVLCGMLAVYAADFHLSHMERNVDIENLSQDLTNIICDDLRTFCGAPEDELSSDVNLSNYNKVYVFLTHCKKSLSLCSTTNAEELIASDKIPQTILEFTISLKRYSLDGDARAVPFARMVKETSGLFAYNENHTDETWRRNCFSVAKCLSIGLLRTELKSLSKVSGEFTPMEPKYEEEEEEAEGEVTLEQTIAERSAHPSPECGKLPTNVEEFHVHSETYFKRNDQMYEDKMFDEVFDCTKSFPYEETSEFLETPLRRLLNFLRVDLNHYLDDNAEKATDKLFGADLTEELLKEVTDLTVYVQRQFPPDEPDFVKLLKGLHALDERFFDGTMSSLMRGNLIGRTKNKIE